MSLSKLSLSITVIRAYLCGLGIFVFNDKASITKTYEGYMYIFGKQSSQIKLRLGLWRFTVCEQCRSRPDCACAVWSWSTLLPYTFDMVYVLCIQRKHVKHDQTTCTVHSVIFFFLHVKRLILSITGSDLSSASGGIAPSTQCNNFIIPKKSERQTDNKAISYPSKNHPVTCILCVV